MKSKKGTEGGDMIIISVIFIICILFGSIGLFATKQFEAAKDRTQEEIVFSSLFTYHMSQYMIQPLDNPHQIEFDQKLTALLDKSKTRQNQQVIIREKKEVADIIDDFHSKYLPEKTCWELRVDGRSIIENTDFCLLRRNLGIDSVTIPVESSIDNVEVIIR